MCHYVHCVYKVQPSVVHTDLLQVHDTVGVKGIHGSDNNSVIEVYTCIYQPWLQRSCLECAWRAVGAVHTST